MQNSNGKRSGGLGKHQSPRDYLSQSLGMKWLKFSDVPIGSAWCLNRQVATIERRLIPARTLFTVLGVSSNRIEVLIEDRPHSFYVDALSFSVRVA